VLPPLLLWESACTNWVAIRQIVSHSWGFDSLLIPVRASGDPLLVIAALALLCSPDAISSVNNAAPCHLAVSAWVGCLLPGTVGWPLVAVDKCVALPTYGIPPALPR
jgi:hypothetical protein